MGSQERKISSTSRFKGRAWPWALFLVICCELAITTIPPHFLAFTEIDRVLAKLEEKRFSAPFVFLGDSVLSGVLSAVDCDGEDYVDLTSSALAEVVGQYFIAKRYLDRNPAPKAFIYIGQTPFWTNLYSAQTRKYVTRSFNAFDEIIDLARTKRSSRFTFDMLVAKLLPSYRYRPTLQRELGLNQFNPIILRMAPEPPDQSLRFLGQNLSEIYFERLLTMLRDRGIELYFWRTARSDRDPYPLDPSHVPAGSSEKYFGSLARRFPNFHFDLNTPFIYPAKLFSDGSHFAAVRKGGGELFYRDLSDSLRRTFGAPLPDFAPGR